MCKIVFLNECSLIEFSMNFGYIRWNKAQVSAQKVLAGVLVHTRLFQVRLFCTNFTWIV